MLKMIKYEYRRGIFSLLVVFFALAILEAYFLISTLVKNQTHSSISISLLFVASTCCIIFVFAYGVISYNNDLKNKYGYMVFMTPLSTYKIIGAKLVSTLLTGVTLAAVIGILGVIDYNLAVNTYELSELVDFTVDIMLSFGYSLPIILLNLLCYIIMFLIEFFFMVTLAYLAISLCSTVLQNKKGKGLVSVILYIILMVAITYIADKIPHIYGSGENIDTMGRLIINQLPQIILYALCMAGSFIGSAALLDKKISL